ncbi:MAG: nickel-dependent lactate racemase [Candidatus Lokiarchaeota archaeon]|nr:nickel-dependent lactate racemase [Candidatus Lokiarchaeota archaeon]
MKFDYGKDGIEIALDSNWNTTTLLPKKQEVIRNPVNKIRNAIRNPLGCPPLETIIKKLVELESVCIVVSDATRPVPTHLILRALMEELNIYGIEEKAIKILVATGLHRPSRSDDLERILGKIAKSQVKVFNHNANDKKELIQLEECSNNAPILINKHYFESDLKILTGYVEPHFFFGFSGGFKSIVPGIAGADTILANHSAENIASRFARFGVPENNPLVENSNEISRKIGVDFAINICINENHDITKIAAGDLEKIHEKLINFQVENVFKDIKTPFDIVVCGNGGFPLDLNLYQAVKSMAIAEMGVKKGGTIISVNECSEGIGIGQDKFKELIFSGMTPEDIYTKILSKEIVVADMWQIQVLARILMKSEVYIISTLNDAEIGNIGLKSAETVEDAINESLKKQGPGAKILLLPNGPQVLPILKDKT